MATAATRGQAPARTEPASPERVPPHSEEAERGVLGSALIDASRVIDLCIGRGVGPEAFYVPAHRALFETLHELLTAQCPVDLLTVTSRLKEQGRLEAIGGEEYLERLIDSTPTSAHAEYYVSLVQAKYLMRSVIDRSRESIEACYGVAEDVQEILSAAEARILSIADQCKEDAAVWSETVKRTMVGVEHLLENPSDITGVSTGFRSLDKVLLGFQPSDMIVLAARPSMGKTALAMNIAEHVTTGGNVMTGYGDRVPRPVAIFSLEMSKEALVRRLVCSRSQVSWSKITKGYVSASEHGQLTQAADALMKAPIYLDDTGALSALELRARARRLHKNHGIQLVIIDYLQMMNYPTLSREGRQRETSAISGSIKAMAKELKVPVLVLSQLSRAPETRDKTGIPKLSDLRDSGSIEQDADVVMLLRRPCRNASDPHYEDKLMAVVDIAKQRNGATGRIDMNFYEEFTRFEDRASGGTDGDVFSEPSAGEVDE